MYDIINNFCHKILFMKIYFLFCVKDEHKHPLKTYKFLYASQVWFDKIPHK